MKSSKKVLAFALAAAMVVTAVPATNAQAASTAKLSAKKATVYSEGYKTVTVKTPKSWKSVKVTATSNKKSVAKVKKTAAKKIKVTGVKPGTAKVTVKVTYKTSTKKNAKAKTKKLTYTMKVAKASVALSGDSAVAVGSTTKLTTTKKASSRAKITYTSSDETIATVSEDGTVKGVKAGKATIKATLKIGKDTATATQEVEVKNYVLSTVAQNKLTELTATVTGNTKNLKATDFAIKSEATNVVYPVSKVTVDSKDASKVTLTLFSELKDAATYDVTLDGITKTFVASDGKVASIALDKATIPYATETEVKLVSKDANGVVVKELKYGETDSNYDFTINTNGNGYTNGSKLYLNKVGDTATAEITYKTGKYDQNGKPEGNIGPNKVTITATAQSEVNNFAVRIDDTAKKFDKAKDTNKIAVNETKVAMFKIQNADNQEISDYSKYTFESSDKSVLMLASNKVGTNNSIAITALKNGTAYILVKKDDKVVGSVAIDIVAERAVATLDVDKSAVTLSQDLTNDTKKVNVTLKDQYGDKWAGDYNLNVECLSTDAKNAQGNTLTVNAVNANAASKYFTFTAKTGKDVTFNATAEKGNYVYKISYKKDNKEVAAKTVSVAVKKADVNATVSAYRLDIDNSNVDMKVDNDNKEKTINIQMIGVADGVDKEVENDATFTVKKADGTKIFVGNKNAETTTHAAISASTGSLVVKPVIISGGALAVKQLDAGTYTVIAEKNIVENGTTKTVTISTSFTITDTQAKAEVEVKNNTVTGNTVEQMLKDAIIVTFDGKTYTSVASVTDKDGALDIGEVEATLNDGTKIKKDNNNLNTNISAGKYFTVTKLTVKVKVATGIDTYVTVTVPGAITAK
uniref:Ig-like domain-containing protein n=1 Tax=Roseburia faecis TaxID=301302 RepID=UPI004029A3D6